MRVEFEEKGTAKRAIRTKCNCWISWADDLWAQKPRCFDRFGILVVSNSGQEHTHRLSEWEKITGKQGDRYDRRNRQISRGIGGDFWQNVTKSTSHQGGNSKICRQQGICSATTFDKSPEAYRREDDRSRHNPPLNGLKWCAKEARHDDKD